jgi:hypothetical protein
MLCAERIAALPRGRAAGVTERDGMRPAGPPRLRDSQRQVIVFLAAGDSDRVRAIADAHRLTLGEALALAVNAEMRAMGLPDALTPSRQRMVHRVRRCAVPRPQACDTPMRRGRKSIAAWYDRREVVDLQGLARECGRSVQAIAEAGIGALGDSEVLAAYLAPPASVSA